MIAHSNLRRDVGTVHEPGSTREARLGDLDDTVECCEASFDSAPFAMVRGEAETGLPGSTTQLPGEVKCEMPARAVVRAPPMRSDGLRWFDAASMRDARSGRCRPVSPVYRSIRKTRVQLAGG